MKQLFFLMVFPFLVITSNFSFGQISNCTSETFLFSDTLNHAQMEQHQEEVQEDFNPGLALFLVIGIGFMLICLGAGIVLSIALLLIIFGLIAAGILSASILVGLHQKSIEKGFKTALISVTSIGGIMLGAVGFYFLNKVVHWTSTPYALTAGAIGGLLTGFLFGWTLFYVFKKLIEFLLEKQNV